LDAVGRPHRSVLSFGKAMTPGDFKRAWEQDEFKLITFPPEVVANLHVSEDQRAFLIQPGLPESAAPYLDFGGKHYLVSGESRE
jgi:hypothetical protein